MSSVPQARDVQQARDVVVARLKDLFTTWSTEQAIEFAVGPERRWWTWGDVGTVHTSLLSVFAGHSVPADSAIAVLMRQRPALLAVELGVLAAGRPALLVTPLQSDRDLVAEIMRVAPAVLVAHETDWERDGLEAAVSSVGTLGISVDDRARVSVRRDDGPMPPGPVIDGAVTVLTSGTTGSPKRLPVGWSTFIKIGGGEQGRPPRSGRGAVILSLPLVTLGGLLSVTQLVFGGRPMAMLERFDLLTWAGLVKEHRPRVIGAPPPVVQMILDADLDPSYFTGVTAFMTSSAPVAPEVATEFERRYGIPVLLGYGATEFLGSVTGWTADLWARFGPVKLGSVGRPHPDVRLRVVDPRSGTELAGNVEGVLEVDPPQRAEQLADGWLRTADRARIDDDGFLWVLGRVDDVIIRGGFKVDLSEVDRALLDHPHVTAACTVGLGDQRLGTVPGAVVTVDDEGLTEADLLIWLRERLAPYAVPTVIRVVDVIPTTSTFKAHRVAVRDLLDRS